MRLLTRVYGALRLKVGSSGSAHRVRRKIATVRGAPMKNRFLVVLAAGLWHMAGGALAGALATPVGEAGSDSSASSDTAQAAPEATTPEAWNLYGQATFVKQYHPGFTSPYQGS